MRRIKPPQKLLDNKTPVSPLSQRYTVYYLFDENEIVYIGHTINYNTRIGFHIIDTEKVFDSFYVRLCRSEKEMLELERKEIERYQPKYNLRYVERKMMTDEQFEKMLKEGQ